MLLPRREWMRVRLSRWKAARRQLHPRRKEQRPKQKRKLRQLRQRPKRRQLRQRLRPVRLPGECMRTASMKEAETETAVR